MNKIELLAPAGSLEKLKMAIEYGADAVYLGGEAYGLRAGAENFAPGEMEEGVEYAHSRGKKVYLTMNIIPHNEDIEGMAEYVKVVTKIGVDAILVSDPGVYSIVREASPDMEIHLSTQANNTNWKSAEFWYRHGVKRIVLARELSLKEIEEIRERAPKDLEFEVFVHGAMCISYSGRCLLSSYMAGRDANRGECAHPCRWKYYLVEEKRPGEYMPVYENERGTFIFNSRDLCMIEHIPELINTGVSSLKIEGRMKSSFYVATVVKAYRDAIDAYYNDPEGYRFNPKWLEEISKVSHREFTTGFYFNKPTEKDQIYNTSSYIRGYDFVGIVMEYDSKTGIATVEQRNRMFLGDEIEVVRPKGDFFIQKIESMKNSDGESIDVAPHPQMTVYMPMEKPVEKFTMLRRKAGGDQ
ncbi:peptidase U32 family protein [Clostridium thermosuccinogenes]|uniref:peptidase U32 family protein n=1 Tax=Clostridium thermosuccinogenes TaxID=84032 RepID=UPI000CCC84E9|nr:U32 family peptidase [Pseudoclostridium thermosuccinogenes]PNT93289.1 peptidase U32 [Pseudoclostridium thermosuccinogenes]